MKLKAIQTIIMLSKYFVYGVFVQVLLVNLLLASNTNAQKAVSVKEVDIAIKSETSNVKDLFKTVEKLTDFNIHYDQVELGSKLKKNIFIPPGSMKVSDLLIEISKQADVKFRQVNKDVSVVNFSKNQSVKEEVLSVQLLADVSITGKVTDENGEGLPGASLVIKGTSTGTTSDLDGNYKLSVPEESILTVSFVGYKTSEITIGSRTVVDVKMELDEGHLEEVVVIGYGEARRSQIIGSIGSVDSEMISQSKGIVSPEQAIQGRVAGVNVTSTSGIPGQGMRVDIRGAASLSGSNEPLYVIDGIPMSGESDSRFDFGIPRESPIAHLNPSDIKSIEILKDASATAIYGSRATNGVVLITTKQGGEGPTKINLSVNTGIENVRKRLDIASSDDYLLVMNEARVNSNTDKGRSAGDPGYQAPLIDPRTLGQEDTDWFDLVTNEYAEVGNVNVNISGGNSKTRFYTSGDYMWHEGLIKSNRIDRATLRLNLDHKAFDRLDLGVRIGLSQTENNRVQNEGSGRGILVRSLEQRPYDTPYKEDGSYTIGGVDILRHNGVQVINEQEASLKSSDVVFNVSGTLEIIKGLSYQLRAGGEYHFSHEYVYLNDDHPRGGAGGIVHDWKTIRQNLLLDNILRFEHSIGERLDFTAMVGHTMQKFIAEPSYISGADFPSTSFGYIVSAARIVDGWTSWNSYALKSLISRVTLDFDSRYMLWATLRRDGSSKFSEQNRYGIFPSISGGWRLSQESFFPDTEVLSEVRLRASYGLTGNQDGIGDFAAIPGAGGGENYGGNTGIAITNVGNPDLTWETANQLNVGLDLSFLSNRLTLTADYFIQNTNNLLYNRPLHTTTGFSSAVRNIGSMSNRGLELAVSSDNLEGRQVKWTTDFNISFIRNELTSLIGETTPAGGYHVIKEGEALGSFFMLKQLGIYQADGEIPQALFNDGVRPGDIIYEDLDGDGDITSDDRQVVGTANPDFFGGITNTLSFGNFDLSAFISFKSGNKIYNNWARRLDSFGTYQYALRSDNIDKRWTGSGTSNTIPRAVLGNYNIQNSTRFLEDGSYLRLQNVTLGYTLPSNFTGRLGIRRARVSFSGRNLITLTKYSGMDPEVSATLSPVELGVDHFSAPQMRNFTFSVEIGF